MLEQLLREAESRDWRRVEEIEIPSRITTSFLRGLPSKIGDPELLLKVYETVKGNLESSGRKVPTQVYSLLVGQLLDLGKKLRELAGQDALTGLKNKKAFVDEFMSAIGKSARKRGLLNLGLLDADNFKTINEEFGYSTGDAALRMFADNVAEQFKRGEDAVYRFGGEEIVVISLNMDPGEFYNRLDEALERLRSGHIPNTDRTLTFTGVAGSLDMRKGVYGNLRERLAFLGANLFRRVNETLSKNKHAGRKGAVYLIPPVYAE